MTNASAPHIYRLSQYGLLSIGSMDNLKFLQGQFTCDVKEVTLESSHYGQWRYGALCTNKGRMISNFLLVQTAANQHVLRMNASTVEAVQNTLKKFAPFYKGALSDVTTEYVIIGLAGKQSTQLIEKVFAVNLTQTNGVHSTEQATLVRLDESRYECWIRKEFAENYLAKLAAEAMTATANNWDLLNIRAGLGEVHKATIEEWTPHMLNLQVTGAINFKKGCYTGQEIVARTEYRGIQKRAMYRISGSGDLPEAATLLQEGAQNAGEVVMASAADSGWEALAVIGDAHLDKALTCNGQPVQLLTLPYTPKK